MLRPSGKKPGLSGIEGTVDSRTHAEAAELFKATIAIEGEGEGEKYSRILRKAKRAGGIEAMLKTADLNEPLLRRICAGKDALAARILSADPTVQVVFLRLTVDHIGGMRDLLSGEPLDGPRYRDMYSCKGFPRVAAEIASSLTLGKLPLTHDDFLFLIDRIAHLERIELGTHDYLVGLVRQLQRHLGQHTAAVELTRSIRRLAAALDNPYADAKQRKMVACLNELSSVQRTQPKGASTSGENPHTLRRVRIFTGEAWSDRALLDLKAMKPAAQEPWAALLVHCEKAGTGEPSPKWLTAARDYVDRIGAETFRRQVAEWFPLVDKPRTQPVERSQYQPDRNLLIGETHGSILKGLAWCCGLQEDAALARALTALAISSYRKVPQIGPRLVRVGNACVWALGNMPGMEGVAQLAILRVRVKFGTAQKLIEKALTATAERVGLPRDELDEMAVPTYGLTDVGVRCEQIAEFTAELKVEANGSTSLNWARSDGKRHKSVPAAVQKGFTENLKELKQAGKDIQRMLPAQRERIDQLHLAQKTWPLARWRERYLDHPLVGTIARRLIWRFERGDRAADGIFCDGWLVGPDDRPLDDLGDSAMVSLWHPIGNDRNAILGWRTWLEEHEVRQPFKQAHREVYLLTDAERSTRFYSNRFAAHIIRQHQFNALCAARGWKNKLRLLVDAEYPPAMLLLPKWNLRAEFWIEGAGDTHGRDTNDTGVFYHVATDQVRFYAMDAAQRSAHAGGGGYYTRAPESGDNPIPLEDIPPVVLSEVMRDVDLFVGVCSVGNDPRWSDGGPEGRYRDYWAGYAFGELTESAKTRRQVLERLIPRLKIADRCSFSDRFLAVRGDIRTYKIHLGSGNILMEPNDQYLCIVKAPERDGGGRVFLPFEGDGMLAVILSKAMLLAEDRKITDPTIMSQIRGDHG